MEILAADWLLIKIGVSVVRHTAPCENRTTGLIEAQNSGILQEEVLYLGSVV